MLFWNLKWDFSGKKMLLINIKLDNLGKPILIFDFQNILALSCWNTVIHSYIKKDTNIPRYHAKSGKRYSVPKES